jgi:hypothetical protein
MTAAIPIGVVSAATVEVASEMTTGRIRHTAEMSRYLRVSKASKQAGVNVTFSGWDFRNKSVNGVVRSLK